MCPLALEALIDPAQLAVGIHQQPLPVQGEPLNRLVALELQTLGIEPIAIAQHFLLLESVLGWARRLEPIGRDLVAQLVGPNRHARPWHGKRSREQNCRRNPHRDSPLWPWNHALYMGCGQPYLSSSFEAVRPASGPAIGNSSS